MEIRTYIIALLVFALIVIYFKYYHTIFVEGLTSNEAVQNIASVFNSSLLTVSNINVPTGGTITVASDSSNSNGIVNLGAINSSRNNGSIDVTGGSLNVNTNSGLRVQSDANFGGNISVNTNATVGGNMNVTGNTNITGNTIVSGNTNVNGTTTLKNTTLSGTVGPIVVKAKTGTVSGDDKFVSITCDAGEVLTGCSCYSAWGDCDGSKISSDGKTCYAYAGSSKEITGTAMCLKVGTGIK